jgi:hypothetical protein
MTRAALHLVALLLMFCIWLSIRRWEFLTPFDLVIVVLQSMVPFVVISVLVAKLIDRRYLTGRAALRIGLVAVCSFPIWLLGWLFSMACVYLVARAGIGVDLLNNSQQFVSSFVLDWRLPVAEALIVAIVGAAVISISARTTSSR